MKRIISIALALVMIFALTATVAALDSPMGKEYYKIGVSYEPGDGSLGTAAGDKSNVKIDAVDEDGHVRLTALKKNNASFIGWDISGKYEIVSGTLKDSVIVVRPLSDIHAVAKFTDNTSTPDQQKATEKPNSSSTSPKTGDPLLIILGLAALALGAGAFAVKKIKE